MPSKDRPNILYIFTDQQYAGAMSCTGNPDLHTPAMDSIAEAGVRFEQAYCTYPLCTPSRASMWTGRMPHEVGVRWNFDSMTDTARQQGLGHILSAAGYECVYGGKWHIPDVLEIPEGHGFRSICNINDNLLADRCVDFLKGRHEKPFFLVASFDNPHNIMDWVQERVLPWGPIPDVPVLENCPNLPPNHAVPPFEPAVIRLQHRAEPVHSFVLDLTPEQWRRFRYAYYRLIEKVDRGIGRVLDALHETGLDEDTLVIFSSDHGDHHGAHSLYCKTFLYEEATRVPLLISMKGVAKVGHVDTAHLISNGLDLFPTVCDYAGAEVPEGLEGRSLRPLLEEGELADWRSHLVAETWLNRLDCAGRMVRSESYKYIVYCWGTHREQLFDLENDPGEMVNLAVESRYKGVLDEHRRHLREWCGRTGDNFGHNPYARPEVPFMVPGCEPPDA